MNTLTNRLAAVIVGGGAVALTVVGAWLNFHGAQVMVPGQAAMVVAWGAVAAEAVKLSWLAGAAHAWRRRNWAAVAMVGVMGLLLHGFSLACAIGIAAADRDVMLADRGGQQQVHTRWSQAYEEAKQHVTTLGGKRPASEVQTDLERARSTFSEAKADEARERKTGCGPQCKAAIRVQQQAQQRIATLETELKASLALAQARTDLRTAREKLDALAPPEKVDPQAAALANFMPAASEASVSKWLPLLPSLIVEIVPVIAIWLAVILWQTGPRQVQTTVQTTVTTSGEGDARSEALHQLKGWLLARDGEMLASQRSIAQALGVPPQTFADWVAKWRESGAITTDRQGNKTVFRLRKSA